MNKRNSTWMILIAYLLHLNLANAQDSLTVDILKPLSHTFIIEKGELKGSGISFLTKRLSKAQFTLLGEYHGSKNISEFTEAIIPHLDELGYHHLVLEVGPNTGAYLNTLPSDKQTVVTDLKNLNTKYFFQVGDMENTPIPFFDKEEDAAFLGEAKERGWNIIGIDQEFVDGFLMQLDWMYANLGTEQQRQHSAQYSAVKDSIHRMYQDEHTKKISFTYSIKKSKFIQNYLKLMKNEQKNLPLVDAFEKSSEIYYLYATRKWYDNNRTRILYMKERLRLGLEAENFDISKDKLLVKMGSYHTSKGFSPLGFYEVGNTLNEIAEFYGNEAVSIGFMNRFEMTENGLEDALDLGYRYYDNHRNFYALGSKNDWVVIDLQPLREGYYYHPQKYKLNKYEEKMIQRFDILIITPTEYQSTNNY